MENEERYSIKFVDEEQHVVPEKFKLHIIDALPIFYKSAYKIMEIDKFSVQPIVRFLYEVDQILKSGDNNAVIVCEDSKVRVKYNLYGGEDRFKKNRSEKSEIAKKHRNLYEQGVKMVCDKLGICHQKVDGYEADDLIYESVLRYHTTYDEIIIHSADSDMFFMTDGIVSIDRGDYGYITVQNFEQVLSSNVPVPYNAAPFYSMYKPKDNRGRIYIDRYREILNLIANFDPILFTNAEITRTLSKDVFKFSDEEMLILNLALPTPIQKCDEDYVKQVNESVDKALVNKLYYGLRNLSLDNDICNDIYAGLKSLW